MVALNFSDNSERQRFEWAEAGHVAFATYRIETGKLLIPYVEAPLPLRGTGAAGRLLEAVTAFARTKQLKIVPICGYAAAWYRRHPELRDTLDG